MYNITARRMTSGELLKYRKGLCIAGDYGTPLPGSRRFTLTKPIHDIGGADAVDALRAYLRHSIVPQARAPQRGGLTAVLPVLGVDLDNLLDGLLEDRSTTGEVAGVTALGDDPRIGECLLPRTGDPDYWVGAESDVGGFAVETYPLCPGFGEAAGGRWLHQKAQAVSAAPIAVATER